MQYTPNFEFELPESNDYAAPPNDNFTKVDTELAKRPAVDEETEKLPDSVLPLSTAATKATPVDADSLALVDSADSNKTKRLLWSRVKAVLATVFAPLSHTHAWSTITGTPSSFPPSAHASTHATGGTDALTASAIGAAASSHNHSASNITSGILSLARGGTGVSSLAALVAALAGAGGVQIATGSYVGTNNRGPSYPTTIAGIPFTPKVIFIHGPGSFSGATTLVNGGGDFYAGYPLNFYSNILTWNPDGATWYYQGSDAVNSNGMYQLNANTTYHWVAIG